jgi:parallel beta-helix repeat protein
MADLEEQIRLLAERRFERTGPAHGFESVSEPHRSSLRHRLLLAVSVVLLLMGAGLLTQRALSGGGSTETVGTAVTTISGATTGELLVSGDLRLTADHEGTIVIVESGITLDCDGKTVTIIEGGAEVGIEIRAGADGVTVTNCIVMGFTNAQISVNGDRSVITDNAVSGNSGGGIGVYSNGNRITNNHASGAVLDGFLVQGSTGNRLEGNLAEGSTVGFSLERTADNELIGNRAIDNAIGFETTADSGSNFLTANTAEGNRDWGFIDNSTGSGDPVGVANTYADNVCPGNGAGSSPSGLCADAG